MVPSFRPEELGEPWWIGGADDGDASARTLLAFDEDGTVVGGIVSEMFPESGVLLLSWLAVRKEARGQRVGTCLMERAAQEWYGASGCQLVLGEIDDPRHWPAGEQDPVQRLRFYDRFGVRALAKPYFQPSVGPQFRSVHHMFLASFDPDAQAILSPGLVDGAVVRKFLEEYLLASAVLCGRDGLDEEDQWLLGFYDGTDIPLVPLLEYQRLPDPHPPESGCAHV